MKKNEDGGNSVDGCRIPHSRFIKLIRVWHKRCTCRWKVENKGKSGSALRTCEDPESQ
jgi:hypothetical protein